MNEALNLRRRRLYYRSWHRGCKETDVVLGHFADSALADLPDSKLDLYEELLEEQDLDIWNWLTGASPLKDGKYDSLLPVLKARPAALN